VSLLSAGAGLGQRLFASIAEVGRMRPHARRHRAPALLGVAAELPGVRLASLTDRRHTDDRHLTILGKVGEMLLHAVLERGAAGLHHIGALGLDVRCASPRGRGGGEGRMGHKQSRAQRGDAGQGPHLECSPVAMRVSA